MSSERTRWDDKVGGMVAQILAVVDLAPEWGGMSLEDALANARRNAESLDSAEWAEVERQVREALGEKE